MNVTDTSGPVISRLQFIGLVVGVFGLVALGVAFFVIDREHHYFYQSYLMGWLLWNGVAVAYLGLLMLHHMVGGEWGFVNRRFIEAGAMTTIVTGILAIPLLLPGAMHHLFEWTHTDMIWGDPGDKILQEKAPYLNVGFFYVRVAIYYAFWIGTAFLLNRWSAQNDKDGSPSFRTKARLLSGPGLLLYVILYTFYCVDFAMSLEPHWMSTIFALMVMVGATLSTFSVTAILMLLFRDTEPLRQVLTPARFWDIGNLMLAFTMLFAYMAFSQYLIGWQANLPEEADYYQHRIGDFRNIALLIVVFHFVVPFFLLLQRGIKKAPALLALVSVLLIVMRYVDLYWIVKPSFAGQPAVHFYWTDLVAPIALGGIWLAAFAFFLKSKLILPVYETHHDRPPVKSEVYSHG
jgi:hypothetical protein